jgi:RNA-directed DNA polymerase
MDLRSNKRRNIQKQLDFSFDARGEAPETRGKGIESLPTRHEDESQMSTDQVMEEVCEWQNMKAAMKQVKTNQGSAGIDGKTVDELPDYSELLVIRDQLLSGIYKPMPVKRVEIPKPDGGVRKLGIPTTLDRFVQQAVMQVLQKKWDPTFSDSSYGFRPGRSTHQAVSQAQQNIAAGYSWVVDLDFPGIYDVLRCKRAISAETALRFGKYFGLPAQFWMNLQTEYDLRLAAATAKLERVRVRTAAKSMLSASSYRHRPLSTHDSALQ